MIHFKGRLGRLGPSREEAYMNNEAISNFGLTWRGTKPMKGRVRDGNFGLITLLLGTMNSPR